MGSGPKWTVRESVGLEIESGQSERIKLDSLKEEYWTAKRDESRRSKRLEVNGPKD